MTTVCAACSDPLIVRVEPDDDDEDVEMGSGSSDSMAAEKLIPDDCHLRCGDHFHWDCLLQNFKSTSCPACGTDLASNSQNGQIQLLCDLNNEGGLQRDHDVLPALREESYLLAHPAERKARAFLEFCKTGDVPAIVEMLQPDDEDDEEEVEEETQWSSERLLRYQDPIGDGYTGLHVAIVAKSQEVVWLLLLLASNLDMRHFPAEVMQEAVTLGTERPSMNGVTDIRTIVDAHGRSAEQLAAEVGGPWQRWLGQGLLSP